VSRGVRNGRRILVAVVNALAVLFLLAGLTVVTADPEPRAAPAPATSLG
jgi:hypothetical protein